MSDLLAFTESVFGMIRGKADARLALKKEISAKFREALTNTEIYVAVLTNQDILPQPETEERLAKEWSGVATICATYDRKLSDICLEVSRYWANSPLRDKSLHTPLSVLTFLSEVFEEKRESKIMFTPDTGSNPTITVRKGWFRRLLGL